MVKLVGVPDGVVSDKGKSACKAMTSFNHLSNNLIHNIVRQTGPAFIELKDRLNGLQSDELKVLLNQFDDNATRVIAILAVSEHIMSLPKAQSKEAIKSLFEQSPNED